jgi:hypothetical protein
MNRENKKKSFEKGYYKNHTCKDSFTCKVCGRLVTPEGAGTDHRNHCPNCLCSLHVDDEPGEKDSRFMAVILSNSNNEISPRPRMDSSVFCARA